jgi:predicted ribonuclease YlaK
VPIIVLDELDDLKRDRRAGDRARSVLHRLWELRDGAGMAPAELKGRRVAIEVFLDDPHHQRLPGNDAEIIDRAVYVGELTGQNVTLVAGDYAMLYRAAAVGLGTALVSRRPRDAAPNSPELVGSPPADLPGDLR